MASTGVVLDPRYREHDPGPGHPERPDRIAVLSDAIATFEGVQQIAPRMATPDEVTLVHAEEHFEHVAQTRALDSYAFDMDTPVSQRSFETACLAAGGLLALLDEVMAGRVLNGFAFVRPPGHHAERRRAMGFCLFNNVAIGAAYLRRCYKLDRVLIMDWDVHHGNGTQHLFENDPQVLYISTHQFPFYPGTGAVNEVGSAEGESFTVNLPFPAGFGDAEYVDAFHQVIEPIAEQYRPQFVLISAGFDPHVRDPLAGMTVTEAGFAAMARSLIGVASKTAAGRCVAVLEGGYDLRAIRDCSLEVLAELRGRAPQSELVAGKSQSKPVLDAARKVLKNYWKL
jgi:acetoin utilization deacetylase AcuC-like enzyme